MRQRAGTFWAAAACVAITLATFGTAAAADLQRDIQALIARANLGDTSVGVAVADLRTGRRLAEVDAFDPLIPASNMKLLTTASALLSVGENFAFETRLVLDGQRLVVVGSGDPGLGDPELLSLLPEPMQVEGLVAFMADAVADAGVRELSSIIIDDRAFDRQPVHPDWPTDQLQYYYCAQVAGVNFHLNVVNVFGRPTAVNQPARVVLEPDYPGVEIENTTRTVGSRTASGRPHASSITIRRDPDANRLRVAGELSRSVSAPVCVYDAGGLLGEALAYALEDAGVAVGSPGATPADAVRHARPGEAFEGQTLLVIKTPMAEVLRRCNTDSYNLYAEALFKRLGHELTGEPGSWTLGAAAVRSILVDALGPAAMEGLRVADGSGMSRRNAIAPTSLVALLAHMNAADEPIAAAFRRSLATPGSGTLRRRFPTSGELRTHIAAKSGYLNGVRSLSGYAAAGPDQPPVLAFAIIMNGFSQADSGRSRQLRNDLVGLLDDYAADNLVREAWTLERGAP